jgi:hypothetical protein
MLYYQYVNYGDGSFSGVTASKVPSKFFVALIVLCVSASGALAQTPPPVPPHPGPPAEIATLRAEIKADVATARAQEKSVAATRQQIQAIRAALKAKLAALHH